MKFTVIKRGNFMYGQLTYKDISNIVIADITWDVQRYTGGWCYRVTLSLPEFYEKYNKACKIAQDNNESSYKIGLLRLKIGNEKNTITWRKGPDWSLRTSHPAKRLKTEKIKKAKKIIQEILRKL